MAKLYAGGKTFIGHAACYAFQTECGSVSGHDLLTYDGNVAPALILQELCHELNAINLHKQEAIACCRQAQC